MINIIELYNSNVLNYTNTGINGQNYLDFFAMLRASIYESVPSVLTTTLTFPSLLTLIPGLVVLLVLGAFIVDVTGNLQKVRFSLLMFLQKVRFLNFKNPQKEKAEIRLPIKTLPVRS